jgi:hypothetical protein
VTESTVPLCRRCGRAFVPAHRWDIYCSIWCRRRKNRPTAAVAPAAPRPPPVTIGRGQGLSPGTVGAVGELMVAADLMQRGYHVFRALSPNAPCDLIAFRSGQTAVKVEVKTGYRKADGTLAHALPVHPIDVLAVALIGGEVVYEPPMP